MEPIKLLPVYLRLELAALRLRHAVAQCVEIIRIPLHHVPTLGQILGFVVHAADAAFLVCLLYTSDAADE